MADVFISYHEKSSGDLVKQIADTLESEGISCWYAKRDLPPGGKFADYIPKEIRSCKVFLLVLNEGSNHSEHVKSETNLAFRRVNKQEQITLVPFKVDNCVLDDDVDYYLSRFNIANGNPADAQSIWNLAERISRILNVETLQTPRQGNLSGEAPDKSNRKFLIAACAVCVALLLTFTLMRLRKLTTDETPTPTPVTTTTNGRPTPTITTTTTDEMPTWTLDENHLSINITGPMDNYGPSEYGLSAPWAEEKAVISSVTILDGVASIGSYAFDQFPSLNSVQIPESVTKIGDGAFRDCTALSHIDIPDSVSELGKEAFSGCSRLKDVVIPNGVTVIPVSLFSGCTGLTQAYIPDSVKEIQANAFHDCKSLSFVSVPNSANIADGAFPETVEITYRETLPEPEPESLWETAQEQYE